MKLIKRSQWGARAPRETTYLASTKGVKVHYVGEHVSPKLVDDHDRCVDLVRGIQRDHMNGNGWADIGYSALVCPHGDVFEGRGPHRLPAANGPGLNSGHYAVCGLVGDSGLVKPTTAMLNGIRDAIEWLRAKGSAGAQIKGHRDGYSTSCPGEYLYKWVRDGAPRPGGKPTPGKPNPPGKPGSPPEWPGRYLAYTPGKALMKGADVKTWQQRMRDRGWSLDADGVYGPRSAEVCRDFQREKKLAVDGIVGPDTWRAAWSAPVT